MASDVADTSLCAYRINDARDPNWDRLMAIYESVFERGEKEPSECLAANLSAEGREKPGGHIVLAAIGAGGDCLGGDCLGGIIFSHLNAVNCGYVSYLMVAPQAQGRGIGSGLVHAARRALDVQARTYPELANGRTPAPMYLAFGSFTAERRWTRGALVSVVDSIFTATYAHLPGAEVVRARIVARLAARPPHLSVTYRQVGDAPVPRAQS
ncbi:MAG: GNAT family N-acetyltransferase [Candidatus Rokubacteria bacterium]|nr:GNAT family N-acetyltransferase [Candidatus Rokubacteria bacterium]